MENENTNRRGFIRKMAKLVAAGGVASLVLGQRVEKVSAAGAANQIAYYTAPDTLTGSDNLRWYNTDRNFVAGYSGNTVTSGVVGATISGGGSPGFFPFPPFRNKVTDSYGTVGGGRANQAGDNAGTTTDATEATVGGGYGNTASGGLSTVSGGGNNLASGGFATVPGGSSNIAAGNCSFAAGLRANAAHDGAFLFSDYHGSFDFNSSAANEFAVRATGGARFVTAIDGTTGAPTKSFVMTPSGNLGVGLSAPARQVHVQGRNAVFRMDRDVDSSSLLLVRTAAGDFSTIWKTFCVGATAAGVNNGTFFIGDNGTNVGGGVAVRLLIDNVGRVGIGTTTPTEKLQVAGNVKATSFITGDIVFKNGITATEEGNGLAFVNQQGTKVAVLDSEGNFHIKGKVIQDL